MSPTSPSASPPASTHARLEQPLRRLRRLRRWRRRLLLHRRSLAALCAAAAVLVGLRTVSPPPAPGVAVWTASRDLPGGSVLAEGDLTRARLPPEAVPVGSLRRNEVTGRVLAAPMSRGEVLTTRRTLDRGLLAGYPDRTAVPVRISDAEVVGLLRVGDRVTLVAGDPEGRAEAAVLARGVPVVALPRASTETLGGSSSGSGRLAVLAVPTAAAEEVAARTLGGYLTVIWSR